MHRGGGQGLRPQFASHEEVYADTRIVFVANPNNPTGTLASHEDVLALVDAIPEHTLLVMDEAYFEFLDPLDLVPRLQDKPNLLLMRTFSKIYGKPGLASDTALVIRSLSQLWRRSANLLT